MRSIGVTAAVSDQRSMRYDIFVALKKVENSGSLPSPDPLEAKPKPTAFP